MSQAGGRLRDAPERRQRRREQRLLEEQVAAGVGGQAELRADARSCAPRPWTSRQQAEVRLGVEGGVGDPHLGHAHGDAREAVPPDVEELLHAAIIAWDLLALPIGAPPSW